MTWEQLANFILKMPREYLDQPVKYLEPYDKSRGGYEIDASIADEDIFIGDRPEGTEVLFATAGEPILS